MDFIAELKMGVTFDGMHIDLLGLCKRAPYLDVMQGMFRFVFDPSNEGDPFVIWNVPMDNHNLEWFAKKYLPGRSGRDIQRMQWMDLSNFFSTWYDEYSEELPGLFERMVRNRFPNLERVNGYYLNHQILFLSWISR